MPTYDDTVYTALPALKTIWVVAVPRGQRSSDPAFESTRVLLSLMISMLRGRNSGPLGAPCIQFIARAWVRDLGDRASILTAYGILRLCCRASRHPRGYLSADAMSGTHCTRGSLWAPELGGRRPILFNGGGAPGVARISMLAAMWRGRMAGGKDGERMIMHRLTKTRVGKDKSIASQGRCRPRNTESIK